MSSREKSQNSFWKKHLEPCEALVLKTGRKIEQSLNFSWENIKINTINRYAEHQKWLLLQAYHLTSLEDLHGEKYLNAWYLTINSVNKNE